MRSTAWGMQVAFVLPFSMLLLVPVGLYRLNWFFPALLILLGAHYLPFATLYGMRMFLFLAGILIGAGWVIAQYFSGTFSLGAWVGGLALFVFAWIGRSICGQRGTHGVTTIKFKLTTTLWTKRLTGNGRLIPWKRARSAPRPVLQTA